MLIFAFGGFTKVCIDTAKKIVSLSFMSQQNYDTAKLCCYRSDFYVLFWYILKKLETASRTNYLFIIYPTSLYATYNIFLFDRLFS